MSIPSTVGTIRERQKNHAIENMLNEWYSNKMCLNLDESKANRSEEESDQLVLNTAQKTSRENIVVENVLEVTFQ